MPQPIRQTNPRPYCVTLGDAQVSGPSGLLGAIDAAWTCRLVHEDSADQVLVWDGVKALMGIAQPSDPEADWVITAAPGLGALIDAELAELRRLEIEPDRQLLARCRLVLTAVPAMRAAA
jgi:hypothetical protein